MNVSYTAAVLLLLATVALGQPADKCTKTSDCTKNQYCNTKGASECEALLKFGDTCIMDDRVLKKTW